MKLEIVEKATAKNGKTYSKLTIDGKLYNYFEPLADDLKVGDEVECEFEQRGQFQNLKSIKKSLGFKAPQITEIRHDIVLNRTEKPHSYEFGKPNARHKIYYGEVAELQEHIKALKEAGFIDETENVQNVQKEA